MADVTAALEDAHEAAAQAQSPKLSGQMFEQLVALAIANARKAIVLSEALWMPIGNISQTADFRLDFGAQQSVSVQAPEQKGRAARTFGEVGPSVSGSG
jgi:hypothetical protein